MTRFLRASARPGRAALVGALMAASIVTPVLAHDPDPALSGGTFDQNQALEFRWRSGSEPPSAIRNAVLDAAGDSNATRASRAATFGYVSTAGNPIGYGTGTCGVNGLACFTRTVPTGFTMWFREHGRAFDWGTLRWCQMLSSPTNGCYDAETIALDEFGHVEVLNHHVNFADESDYTDAVVQTYSRTRPKTGWDMHAYGRCDTATLQMKYDLPTLSSLYSRCLDIVTVLTLSISDTSVPYAGLVDFTAYLKAATNTAYGRLSANPIGGRTVRLQRRGIGSTTWANLVTLPSSSTAGTYAASLRLYGSADFRAVFSTPTNEGVRGDTSPTVRITVAPCTANCPIEMVAG
ncbi:MAG TPA: hypothetical protein VFN41_12490 [Candidatus Limnocylindrales bacterium]|nr:hypothetical protein [Candidatus Limnocylindrales bacterium]